MICYKDRTFCKYNDCKDWKNCDRAFTDKVKKEADEWWGGEAPICVWIEHPECYEKELEKEHESKFRLLL